MGKDAKAMEDSAFSDFPVSEPESEPLLAQQRLRVVGSDAIGGSMGRFSFMLFLAFGYMFCIVPTVLPGAMIPSLEADMGLDWGPKQSGFYIAATGLSEAFGLICIGRTADFFGGIQVLGSYLFLAGCGITVVSYQYMPAFLIGAHCCVSFLKGLAWPAVVATVNENFSHGHRIIGILMVGMASRFGDAATFEVFGMLLTAMQWRCAIECIACGLMGVAMVASLYRNLVGDSQLPSLPVDCTAPAPPGLGKVLSDRQMLMYILFVVCVDCTWVFEWYPGVFAHRIYNVDVSASAAVNGAFPFGQFTGLAFGLMLMLVVRERHQRAAMIASMVLLLMIVPINAVLYFHHEMTLVGFISCVFALGFCMSFAAYVPGYMYCMRAGEKDGAVAFRAALLSCCGDVSTQILAFLISCRRSIDETSAYRLAIAFSSCGAVWAALMLVPLLGLLMAEEAEGDDEEREERPESVC